MQIPEPQSTGFVQVDRMRGVLRARLRAILARHHLESIGSRQITAATPQSVSRPGFGILLGQTLVRAPFRSNVTTGPDPGRSYITPISPTFAAKIG